MAVPLALLAAATSTHFPARPVIGPVAASAVAGTRSSADAAASPAKAAVTLRISSSPSGGDVPLLVCGTGAGPDLQPGCVRGVVSADVDALAGAGADDVVRCVGRPALVGPAGAVPQLQLCTVRRGLSGDVEALAECADRAVGADGPLLRGRAVAVVELGGGAVRAVRARDVHALAGEAGDRPGAGAAAALRAVPGERRRRVTGQVVGERGVAPVHAAVLGALGRVVCDQRLGAVGVAPGDVADGRAVVRIDAGRARLHELGQVTHGVVLDRVVDLAAASVSIVDGDEAGAGTAAAVVRSHVLVDGEAPLHEAAAPVARVVDEVVHVLGLLIGHPGATGVFGVVGVDVRELVVHGRLLGDVAAVAVPGHAAEVRVVADRGVVHRRRAETVVGVPVPVQPEDRCGPSGGLQCGLQ